jgi:thioredoxin 1
MIQKLNEADFQKVVVKDPLPVVVDFNAAWCGPCKKLAPILEELSKEQAGKANFYEVDAGNEPGLAQQFGVMSLPTILFLKNGEVKDKIVGLTNKEKIVETLKKI